ncbi:MAG TPA: alpha/beta hydrolase [Candidatus Eisenbacteria bacterium]
MHITPSFIRFWRMLALAGAVLLLCLPTPASALRPERGYRATPADYGILYREVAIVTRDSLLLRGWLFPAQDTTGIANELVGTRLPVPPELRPGPRPYPAPGGARRPTIVICDGDAGNMTYVIFYAYHLFIHGFNVLTFDWRGFGESAEWPLDPNRLCAAEFLIDYDAALDFAVEQPEVRGGPVGVLGFSTGAYLSFAEAARRRDVAAFAGRALISSLDDLLDNLRKVDPDRPWTVPADYPDSLMPVRAAARMSKPAFLVVGEKDPRTPPWMSRKVFDRLRGPKELWVVPGAEHGGSKAPEKVAYPEFFERLVRFFGEHLK